MGTWKLPEACDLPDEVGRYVLHEILGQGGMARVYRAELHGPAGFRKMVALKIVLPKGLETRRPEETAFLVREARLGGMLRHPHIVDIYELGTVEGVPFISMELVDGPSLADLLKSHGPPPPPISVQFAQQIVDALCVAHTLDTGDAKRGVVHRDLKPANILIDLNGFAKVADFGLADLTSRLQAPAGGQVFGTPAHMSPEQLRGDPLDPRSDQFSFGTLFYEMLTGDRLYASNDHRRTASMILDTDDKIRKRAAARLNAVVPDSGGVLWRCLQQHPTQRYASTEDLADALRLLKRRPVWPVQIKRWLADPTAQPPDTEDLGDSVSVPRDVNTLLIVEDPASNIEPVASPMLSGIPDEPNVFIGRTEDQHWVMAHLKAAARLVTIKGPGGMGKTRLCMHLAAVHRDRFVGGVVWAELSEASTEDDVVDIVSRSLGVNTEGEQDAVGHLGRVMGERGASLLVLDTCDRARKALGPVLTRWIDIAPKLQILLTSRERLRMRGEKVVELNPMVEVDGARLFTERALVAMNGTGVDPSLDAARVLDLVRRLEGMPLSIELAAARMSTLTLAELDARLGERFDLLRAEGGDDDRAATLRGTIEWSWNLLEPSEQTALAQLSVFHGGFFFEDAEGVVQLPEDAPWVMDVIGTLYDKSLLHSWSVDGAPRFGMYAAIREYAAERLAEGGPIAEAEVGDRHVATFARKGHAEALRVLKQASHDPSNDSIRLERSNLVAALGHAVRRGAVDHASALAQLLSLLSTSEGRHGPSLVVLDDVLAMGGISEQQRARLLCLHLVAETYAARPGLLESGEALLALTESVGDLRLRVQAMTAHGRIVILSDGPVAARPVLLEALESAMELQDAFELALVEGLLATAERELGNQDRALRLFVRSRDRFALAGLIQGGARAQMNLAHIMYMQGRNQEARELLDGVLALARHMGDQSMEGNGLRLLGGVLDAMGQTDDAIAVVERAARIQRSLGSRIASAGNFYTLASILVGAGEVQRALDIIEWPIEVARKTSSTGLLGGALAVKGLAAALVGQAEVSAKAFDESKTVLERFGVQWLIGRTSCRRAEAALALGNDDEAQEHLKIAWRIAREQKVGPQSPLGRGIARVEGLLARR